ncbi:hypothetical protein [uncultured Maribacter sp.]|nr:hypothetical protein [uncultured Maribacter sp.]
MEFSSYSSEIELPPYDIVVDEELNDEAVNFVSGKIFDYSVLVFIGVS